MPEAYGYAYAVTLSGRGDIPDDVVQAVVEWFEKATMYYGVALERDANGRLHLHAGIVFKSAKLPSNVKKTLLYPATVREWFSKQNQKVACKIKRMCSEFWLTTYMQKEGPLLACNFPDDLEDVAHAFAHEKAQKKEMNPEFARWARMYRDQERPIPAHEASVYAFFHDSMYVDDTLKICTDQKRLRDRVMALVSYLNKTPFASHDGDMYHGIQKPAYEVSNARQERFAPGQIREIEAFVRQSMDRDN